MLFGANNNDRCFQQNFIIDSVFKENALKVAPPASQYASINCCCGRVALWESPDSSYRNATDHMSGVSSFFKITLVEI